MVTGVLCMIKRSRRPFTNADFAELLTVSVFPIMVTFLGVTISTVSNFIFITITVQSSLFILTAKHGKSTIVRYQSSVD